MLFAAATFIQGGGYVIGVVSRGGCVALLRLTTANNCRAYMLAAVTTGELVAYWLPAHFFRTVVVNATKSFLVAFWAVSPDRFSGLFVNASPVGLPGQESLSRSPFSVALKSHGTFFYP